MPKMPGGAPTVLPPVFAAPFTASASFAVEVAAAVVTAVVVAAAEVVVGLGILVSILRSRPGSTADDLAELRG